MKKKTPNQNPSRAYNNISCHEMVLTSSNSSIATNNIISSNNSKTRYKDMPECQVVLDNIMFKDFTSAQGSSKSQKYNNLIEKFNCKVLLNDIRNNPVQPSIRSNSNLISMQKTCGDGSDLKIKRCRSIKCKFQNKFLPQNSVISSTTHHKYNCIRPSNSEYINCHTSNCVYLITCTNCSLQYVGETAQKLNERFAFHNTCLLYPTKYSFCRILSNHFNEGHCKGADYFVTILEKLPGSGRTERGAVDLKTKSERKTKEK